MGASRADAIKKVLGVRGGLVAAVDLAGSEAILPLARRELSKGTRL